MANSALYSEKASEFNPSTASVGISIDLHRRNTSNVTLVPIKGGSGSRVFDFSVTATDIPNEPIEASFNNGAYVEVVPLASELTSTFQLTIPIGTHTLKCRLASSGSESQTVTVVGSRFVFLGTGQSNMRGTGDASAPLVPSASGHKAWLLRNSDNVTEMISEWDESATGQIDNISRDSSWGDAWMIRYANLLLAEYDEPVVCIPAALGGCTIDQFVKDSSYTQSGRNLYSSAVRRANVIGGVTLNIYQQSENDAVDSKGTTNAQYQDMLNGLINDFASDLGVKTLIIPLHTISRSNYSGSGGGALTDSGQDALRSAQIAVAASNENAYITPPLTSVDLTGGDNIHFRTDEELNYVAQAAFDAMKQIMGEVSRSVSFSGGGVAHGDTVNLSLSTDVTPSTYVTWAQVNNGAPTVVINNHDSVSASYVAPSDDSNIKIAAYVSDGQYGAYDVQTFTVYATANQPPVANAGPDQSVAAATQFTLDGTGSQDTDGTIVEWRWTQTEGDPVTLNLEDPARPTATSPSKTTAQRLTFQLVTVDDEGAESSPGTVNIDVAAFAVSEMLKLLDTRQWTVVNDGSVQAFEGRSNREAFRFQVTPSDGIQTSAEGYFLFDQPGVHAVEVISTATSKISSVDDPHMIRGDVIAARIGDLQTDENGNLTLTFVLYVTDDKDGLVMTAKVIEPYQKASYFRKQG